MIKSIEEYKIFVDDDYLEYAWKYWEVDNKIAKEAKYAHWLHFALHDNSDSSLFIDFTPSATGKKGQIIRYVHDPDELHVIADNFDDYLQMLIDKEYDFVWED
jgi:cell wall assembly regulator SMI1